MRKSRVLFAVPRDSSSPAAICHYLQDPLLNGQQGNSRSIKTMEKYKFHKKDRHQRSLWKSDGARDTVAPVSSSWCLCCPQNCPGSSCQPVFLFSLCDFRPQFHLQKPGEQRLHSSGQASSSQTHHSHPPRPLT